MPLGRENLSVEELALAYELAVSSLRTNQITTKLTTDHPHLTPEQYRDVMLTVIELRVPDDEFIVGDRVKFTHWVTHKFFVGTVSSITMFMGEQMLKVETDEGWFSMEKWRCAFAD